MDTQSVITAEAWPISPSLLVAILAAVALVVSTSLLSFLRRRSPLPPGPSPWPILGNLPQLGLLPHRALAKLADRYGPIMTIWFGSTPTLIVSSPEVACDVMKTNDKLCSSRPVLKTVAIFSLDGQNIAFSPDNDHWRKMRRLATLHLLSAKKLQESLPVREEEIRGMLDAIAVDAATTADVTKGGKPAAPADDGIEVRRYLTRATLNNILRLTVGKRFCYSSIRGAADVSSKAILEAAMKIDWNERIAAITGEKCGGIRGDAAEAAAAPATGSAAEKKEGEMLIALIEEGFSLAGSFNLADYVPWLGAGGDPLGMYTRAKRATPQLHGFMRSCIEERRQLAARKEEKEFETTLVDVLLEMEGDGEDEINKTELLMLALDMMLAGTDSTSKTVEWTLAELVQHPDVLERLRAEVDAAYAKSASAAAETGAPGGESGVELEGRGKGREGEEEGGEEGLEGGRWVGEQKGLEEGKWVAEDEGLDLGRWGERGGAGGREVGGGRGGVGEGKRRRVQLARLFQSTPFVRSLIGSAIC
ncbi:unnamed protein product [Closterium sp. Naga37s-1]|nr:unnamed protein product [Closterium sp. Naga37s-1]